MPRMVFHILSKAKNAVVRRFSPLFHSFHIPYFYCWNIYNNYNYYSGG